MATTGRCAVRGGGDQASAGPAIALKARRRASAVLAAAAMLLGSIWLLHHQFASLAFATVVTAWRAQRGTNLVAALSMTALSFFALALYDVLATRMVAPGRVPLATALLAGGAANAVSNTLGFHAFTGSAVRLRLYRAVGLSSADSARIVSLSWLALGLGFLTMLAVAALMEAALESHPGRPLMLSLGIVAGLALFTLWLSHGERRVTLFRFGQPLPPAGLALLQMAIGGVEMAAALGALYLLLPADLAPPFSSFAVACIGVIVLGIAAHAPGGIGVFEAGLTAALGGAGRADLLAALISYRLIYNLLPFAVAIVALAVSEWRCAEPC